MKKLLALLLTGCMLAATVTGCGAKNETTADAPAVEETADTATEDAAVEETADAESDMAYVKEKGVFTHLQVVYRHTRKTVSRRKTQAERGLSGVRSSCNKYYHLSTH